jgi:DNA polymerase-4
VIASAIRDRIQDERHLTGSVGVAPTKFVAKLASEAAKPKASVTGPAPGLGVKVVTDADLLAFLHPLPVQALWGVGPATLAKLERLGVSTVGELAAMPVTIVTSALGGAAGNHLHQLAHGIDERRVEPDRQAKSIGHEETFVEDRRDRAELERELVRFADAIGSRLRRAELAGRTVSIKVRFGDFHTISRSATLADPTDSHQAILRAARQLLDGVDPAPGVRLLGVSISGLTADPTRQLSLDEVDGPDWTEANRAIDEIRERFGATAIGPAAIADADGLRIKRKGNQQWGPNARDDGSDRRPPR